MQYKVYTAEELKAFAVRLTEEEGEDVRTVSQHNGWMIAHLSSGVAYGNLESEIAFFEFGGVTQNIHCGDSYSDAPLRNYTVTYDEVVVDGKYRYPNTEDGWSALAGSIIASA